MNIYARLIAGWRDMLSVIDTSRPFKHNNYSYRSIEHYCLNELMQLIDPVVAKNFSLDSGHELGLMEPNDAANSPLLKNFQ